MLAYKVRLGLTATQREGRLVANTTAKGKRSDEEVASTRLPEKATSTTRIDNPRLGKPSRTGPVTRVQLTSSSSLVVDTQQLTMRKKRQLLSRWDMVQKAVCVIFMGWCCQSFRQEITVILTRRNIEGFKDTARNILPEDMVGDA